MHRPLLYGIGTGGQVRERVEEVGVLVLVRKLLAGVEGVGGPSASSSLIFT